MSNKEAPPRGRYEEGLLLAQAIMGLKPSRKEKSPVQVPPLRMEQWKIITTAWSIRNNSDWKKNELFQSQMRECADDPNLFGKSRGQFLLEYTSAALARSIGLVEFKYHKLSNIQFAIPGIGHEVVGVILEGFLKETDLEFPYYRQESNNSMRGGTILGLALMTAQKQGDPHSDGVVLAGHIASASGGMFPTVSNVGAQALPSAGAGRGLQLRQAQGTQHETWEHMNDSQAITVCHIGDASMAQGEVKEALDEMTINGGSPVLLIVNNNESGISTDVSEGSVDADPIASARGYKDLKIFEVEGTDIQGLYRTFHDATAHVRYQRKPAVVHITHIYKLAHSSSDDMTRYHTQADLIEMAKHDPMPIFKQYLVDHGIADEKLLTKIEDLANTQTEASFQKALALPDGDPRRIYNHHFSETFHYGPYDPETLTFTDDGLDDFLESSREPGVYYPDKLRTDTQTITMRHAVNAALARAMAKHSEVIYFGEDVADLSFNSWKNFDEYFWDRFGDHTNLSMSERLEFDEGLDLIKAGRGSTIDPDTFGKMVDVLGGKGGVFKSTQFLQYLFGRNRIWNSRLAEASILGTAVGFAIAGYVPVVEIQFDSYIWPGWQQLIDQIATLRWRSGGQFKSGMVINLQDLNRFGGVGAIGHGNVILGKLISIPGIRTVIPGDASSAGPLLNEAIRLAREHGEIVVFYEPIMELNSNIGHLQDADAHIPIGEANVRQIGEDFLVLTYGNNIPLVEKAQEHWKKQTNAQGKPISATIIDLRTLDHVDWPTISPWIKKHGKILIVESEKKKGSAGTNLAADVGEYFFEYLDAPVKRVSARNVHMPAGRLNEAYALPQINDVVTAGITLARY